MNSITHHTQSQPKKFCHGIRPVHCRWNLPLSKWWFFFFLTYVCNLHQQNGFSPALKTAKVIPLSSAKAFIDPNKLGSISFLFVLCRPFEKHSHKRLTRSLISTVCFILLNLLSLNAIPTVQLWSDSDFLQLSVPNLLLLSFLISEKHLTSSVTRVWIKKYLSVSKKSVIVSNLWS